MGVPELEQRESTARHTGDSTRTCLTGAHQLVGLYGCLYGTLKDRRNEGLDVLACSTSVGERSYVGALHPCHVASHAPRPSGALLTPAHEVSRCKRALHLSADAGASVLPGLAH